MFAAILHTQHSINVTILSIAFNEFLFAFHLVSLTLMSNSLAIKSKNPCFWYLLDGLAPRMENVAHISTCAYTSASAQIAEAKAKANNYKCVVLLMMIKPPSKYKLHIIRIGVEQQWQLQHSTQMNEIRIQNLGERERERVESATVSDFALYCYFGAFDLMLMIHSILYVSPAVLCSLDLFTLTTCHTKTDFLDFLIYALLSKVLSSLIRLLDICLSQCINTSV